MSLKGLRQISTTRLLDNNTFYIGSDYLKIIFGQSVGKFLDSYTPSNKVSKLKVLMLTSVLLTSYSNNSFALSAQTANTIRGTEPYMLLSDGVTKVTTLDDLLSFEMPHQDLTPGTETITVEMAGTTILFPQQ